MNTSSINAEFRRDMNKSPSELEREIDMTRASLETTLEALEHRLSPSDMLGQLWSSLRQHGGEFGGSLGESVKAHPMPALLTTIGIAWMMASDGQRSTGNGYGRHVGNGSGRHRMREAAHDSAQRMRASGARVKDKLHRARDAMHRSREGAREGVVGARERMDDARERFGDARERLGETAHSVGSRARAMSETARYRARRAGSGFSHLLEEQPLLLGAIGLAAGVIAGAALPPTEQEDRAFGSMRDRTLDRARQAGAEGAHRAREQVERVAENAREKMESAQGNSNGHYSASETRRSESSGMSSPPSSTSSSSGTSSPSSGDSAVSPPSSSRPSDADRTSSPGTGLGY